MAIGPLYIVSARTAEKTSLPTTLLLSRNNNNNNNNNNNYYYIIIIIGFIASWVCRPQLPQRSAICLFAYCPSCRTYET
jgi:hypothetical protein